MKYFKFPLIAFILGAALAMLAGCTGMKPPLRVTFPPLVIPEGGELTDREIFNDVSKGEALCGDKAGRAQIATNATALTLKALAAGATIAATRGASGMALGAVASGGSFLDDVFSIYRPDERLNAYDTCLDMLEAAKAVYLKGSRQKIQTFYTPLGAQLYEDYGHAKSMTRALIKATMPNAATLQRYLDLLNNTVQKAQSDAMIEAVAQVAAKAAKLALQKEKENTDAKTTTTQPGGGVLIPGSPNP